jgi:hypothetical protein
VVVKVIGLVANRHIYMMFRKEREEQTACDSHKESKVCYPTMREKGKRHERGQPCDRGKAPKEGQEREDDKMLVAP